MHYKRGFRCLLSRDALFDVGDDSRGLVQARSDYFLLLGQVIDYLDQFPFALIILSYGYLSSIKFIIQDRDVLDNLLLLRSGLVIRLL